VAIAVLLIANAVPLVGVAALGWDLSTLVAVYWAENGVVGVYAIGRILTAGRPIRWLEPDAVPQPPPPPRPPEAGVRGAFQPGTGLPRVALVPFFCVHYGIFWLVHGIFVWTVLPFLFLEAGASTSVPDGSVVVTASIVLFLSHGVSFVFNWLLGGEHLTSTPQAETNAPYARVIVLHLTILLGAFAAAMLGASIAALVVMVVLKTGVDLSAHLAERRRAAVRADAAPVPVPEGLDAPAV
jgi:hypothetical protein